MSINNGANEPRKCSCGARTCSVCRATDARRFLPPLTAAAAKAATTLGPQQSAHGAPYFLPDGGRFLFFAMGAPDTAGIYLGALDERAPTRLTPGDGSGVYLPDGLGPGGAFRAGGWLLWVRTGTLVAQQDVEKAVLTGEPLTVADGVATEGSVRSAVSVAAAALVAYRTGTGSQRQLTWFDRSGTARAARSATRMPRSPLRACPPRAVASLWPARCEATPTSGCSTAFA